MVLVSDIYQEIDEVAPFATALDFDRVGLLVGSGEVPVTRALLALDITREVVEEAASKNCNLIISHHPVIFHPLEVLDGKSVPYLLASKGIHALCCHTNLDASGVCGVNVALAKQLGLVNCKVDCSYPSDLPLFTGELPQELEPAAFAQLVREKLHCAELRYVKGEGPIRKVCLSAGAGADALPYAQAVDAQAFLTGELKYHEALEAREMGITAVAAGHYETEKPFAQLLAAHLKKRFPDIGFLLSQQEENPFVGN